MAAQPELSTSFPVSTYQRYHLEPKTTPNVERLPSRFTVKVKRPRLAWLLVKELFHYRFNMPVVLSRPCVYGVFSGPIGGFAPRPQLCVGCLRCTTQYPDMVQIGRNPKRKILGDPYFTSESVDTVLYEAETGRVPVRGAGYRGRFGGEGWDGMWTDMSEIVRPTRDGIHGREFISTSVDIGEKPLFLEFDAAGEGQVPPQHAFSLPVPFLFDLPPTTTDPARLRETLVRAARETQTLVLIPLGDVKGPVEDPIVPIVRRADHALLDRIDPNVRMIELAGWDEALAGVLRARFPQSVLALHVPFAPGYQDTVATAYDHGVRVFHLVADFHGRGADHRFALELIREAHGHFVQKGVRDAVTLIGSGGIVMAEHVPKSIICGLDAVALDTPPVVALQGAFEGACRDRLASRFRLPAYPLDWGVQRLTNLVNSWRDQLLEILGAMGMREVRRLRGEIGRCMLQSDLENEAFGDIANYGNGT